MKTCINFLLVVTICVSAMLAIGCGSAESPQTQQLYTDAKKMWDEINRAFVLPKSQERSNLMFKIINEKWDEQILNKLDQYLKEAPSGKFAKEAKSLMEQARRSDQLRALAQFRPLANQVGVPKTPAEADSLARKLQQQRADTSQRK